MKRIKYSEEYIQRRVKWYHECWAFIKKANYKKATAHAKLGFKLFPDDTIAQFTYYSIMADYALSEDSLKFNKMHKEATQGMKKLFKKTSGRGISIAFKKVMKNEYYFQTKQYKKQYYLGITGYQRSKDFHDMYSAGVGGAQHALVLARKKNYRMAKNWAQKSVDAWKIYLDNHKTYYNPYVHLALAYGILGKKKEMMSSLKTSSKLCKKPLSYREFQEVREWVDELFTG